MGSVQVGKSYLLARLLVEQVLTSTNPYSDLAICFSPTYRMARVMQREVDAVLKQSPRLWESVHKRNDSPVTYTFPNGKILEFHSLDQPDAIRGLRPFFIGVDEGSYISEEAYDVLEGRTLQTGAPIVITTTPRGKRHWLYRRVFVPGSGPESKHYVFGKHDPERVFVQTATVYDNPFIEEKERVAMIASYGGPNSLWAKQELFGEFVDYQGLVFTGFNEDTCVVMADKVPVRETLGFVAAGQDWGVRDPSVILVGGVKDGIWWIVDEFYEPGVEIDALGAEMAAMQSTWGVKRFWADSAEPARISHYRKQGLPVYPVVKPRIVPRVHYLNSLFQQGRLMISAKCINLIRELATYQWPADSGGVKDERVNPIGSDHTLDSLAYLTISEKGLLISSSPLYNESSDTDVGEWRSNQKPVSSSPAMTAGYFD